MNERELCKKLIRRAERLGWVAYAETSGWDILLCRGEFQVGVEAKLRSNLRVLRQALPPAAYQDVRARRMASRTAPKSGPDFRAVLVPSPDKDIQCIAANLGIWVFGADGCGTTLLRTPERKTTYNWSPREHCWLPDFKPDVDAGVPSPTRLTAWKQRALRLLARAEVRGYVTSLDARELKLRFATFTKRYPTWFVTDGSHEGRCLKWALIPREACKDLTRPDMQHPRVFEQVTTEQRTLLVNRDVFPPSTPPLQ